MGIFSYFSPYNIHYDKGYINNYAIIISVQNRNDWCQKKLVRIHIKPLVIVAHHRHTNSTPAFSAVYSRSIVPDKMAEHDSHLTGQPVSAQHALPKTCAYDKKRTAASYKTGIVIPHRTDVYHALHTLVKITMTDKMADASAHPAPCNTQTSGYTALRYRRTWTLCFRSHVAIVKVCAAASDGVYEQYILEKGYKLPESVTPRIYLANAVRYVLLARLTATLCTRLVYHRHYLLTDLLAERELEQPAAPRLGKQLAGRVVTAMQKTHHGTIVGTIEGGVGVVHLYRNIKRIKLPGTAITDMLPQTPDYDIILALRHNYSNKESHGMKIAHFPCPGFHVCQIQTINIFSQGTSAPSCCATEFNAAKIINSRQTTKSQKRSVKMQYHNHSAKIAQNHNPLSLNTLSLNYFPASLPQIPVLKVMGLNPIGFTGKEPP